MASKGEKPPTVAEAEPAEVATNARARTILTVKERVAHIRGIMLRLEWTRGVTGHELADEWGLSYSAVCDHAAEASRQIVGDKDEAARDITAGARQLMQLMLQSGDAKAFTAVANLLADVSGAKAPTKQEVSVGPVNSATAASFVREAFGEKALPRDLDTEDAPEPGDVPEESSSD